MSFQLGVSTYMKLSLFHSDVMEIFLNEMKYDGISSPLIIWTKIMFLLKFTFTQFALFFCKYFFVDMDSEVLMLC